MRRTFVLLPLLLALLAAPSGVASAAYRYRFTSRAEHRATGAWWDRTLVGEYMDPVALRDVGR